MSLQRSHIYFSLQLWHYIFYRNIHLKSTSNNGLIIIKVSTWFIKNVNSNKCLNHRPFLLSTSSSCMVHLVFHIPNMYLKYSTVLNENHFSKLTKNKLGLLMVPKTFRGENMGILGLLISSSLYMNQGRYSQHFMFSLTGHCQESKTLILSDLLLTTSTNVLNPPPPENCILKLN